jgi:hypothetical protein
MKEKQIYKCHCDNGFKTFEENDRQVTDACYHCSNTGWIDKETYQQDRISDLAEILARTEVDDMIKHYDSDPSGEGWEFAAAEEGCSVYEYTLGEFYYSAARIMEELKIVNENCPRLLSVLLDHHVPSQRQFKWVDENGQTLNIT